MSYNSSKIIAFNYFGGKYTYLDYLYSCFPKDFTHLVELFAGSMVVSLNYKGRVIKTANEINEDITNFFQVLRDNESDLIRLLLLTPCSKTKVNAQGGETVSRWNNAIKKLHAVAEILRSEFQILNKDYKDIISMIDHPKGFFYCDPPYPEECRASYNDYKFEFTNKDHEDMADRLHSIEGFAMVSSYDCDLMNNLYSDWYQTKFPVKKNNIRSGNVQEVIYTNYNPVRSDMFQFNY